MPSQEITPAPTDVWVIEHVDTKLWLGTHDRVSLSGVAFGNRMPLFYNSLRYARNAWLSHSVRMGFLRRGVTLPAPDGGRTTRFLPGEDFDLWPRVQYRKLHLVPVKVAVDTDQEIGIEK